LTPFGDVNRLKEAFLARSYLKVSQLKPPTIGSNPGVAFESQAKMPTSSFAEAHKGGGAKVPIPKQHHRTVWGKQWQDLFEQGNLGVEVGCPFMRHNLPNQR